MKTAAQRENQEGATVRPASVEDAVYDSIYERLMSLAIAPGSRIPIDVMARELNVSQTPVRGALSRLEREGLVYKAHMVGYSAAPQLNRKQFEDLFNFRLLIEPEGARLAAQNMTPAALHHLEEIADDMAHGAAPVDRTSRYSRFARIDAHFHDEILRIAGNEVIRSTLFNQHIHLHLFRLMFHSRVTQEALEEHNELLAAFRAGDSVTAETAMREHILRSRDRLMLAFE